MKAQVLIIQLMTVELYLAASFCSRSLPLSYISMMLTNCHGLLGHLCFTYYDKSKVLFIYKFNLFTKSRDKLSSLRKFLREKTFHTYNESATPSCLWVSLFVYLALINWPPVQAVQYPALTQCMLGYTVGPTLLQPHVTCRYWINKINKMGDSLNTLYFVIYVEFS